MTVTDLSFRKHYEEMRDLWQARTLEYSTGKMTRVLQSVLAHVFPPDSVATLFKVVYPNFKFNALPMYVSAGRIFVDGTINARKADKQEDLFNIKACPWSIVFKNETEMTKDFRKLADAVKLTDPERKELFAAAKAWIVCDYRQPVSGMALEDYLDKRNGH